jgi:hypothetical protein
MRTRTLRVATLMAAWLLSGMTAGCGEAPNPNLSPTPDQAADRHQQAIRYSQERAGKNRLAERKAMGRMARPSPHP